MGILNNVHESLTNQIMSHFRKNSHSQSGMSLLKLENLKLWIYCGGHNCWNEYLACSSLFILLKDIQCFPIQWCYAVKHMFP